MAVPSSAKTYQDIYKGLGSLPFQTDMDAVRARQAQLAGFLGTSDYASRMEEANNLAKFQMALAMAQRGFAGMGATPKRGQSGASALLSNVFAPLAGDIGTVAVPLMQQRAAAKTAQEQEERQLKLAALSQVQAEEAARRNVALKLTPTTTAKGPYEQPRFVVIRNASGEYEFPDPGNPRQVRQQKGAAHPMDLRTLQPYELKKGEVLVTGADLPDNLKGAVSKKGTIKISDTNLARKWIENPNDPGKLILGPELFETKVLLYPDGKTRLIRPDLTATDQSIKIGSAKGEYQMYQKPSAPGTKKGLEDPDFKASFHGILAQAGRSQRELTIGRTGVRFNTTKFNLNPGLNPGKNFPFERVVGEDAEGNIVTTELAEDQQKAYAVNLKSSYKALFDKYKGAPQELISLGGRFLQNELTKSASDLGLPPVGAPPADVTRAREQITNPSEITRHYVRANDEFKRGNVQETLDKSPLPVGIKNLRSGTGRLVLFNDLGVPFGDSTVSPAKLQKDAPPADVVERADVIRSLDRQDIQARIFAERLSKETQLGTKLRPSTADTTAKQIAIVGEALDKKKEALDKALADPEGKEIGVTLGKSLDTVAMLDRLDVQMKQSGIGGFVLGPLEEVFRSRLGMDIGSWLRTEEGQEAANEFMASLPILRQLVARDLAKGTGEIRISNMDLKGIQATLLNINKADDFNADTLRKLRNYLKGSIKHSLDYVGSYGLPERTLEKAAQLGVDVKSIKGRNGYYSPYLEDQNYAVTKQPVPSFSGQYQKQLRDQSIFGYVATRGAPGQSTQYRLVQTDANGKPIPKLNNNGKVIGYQTVLIPKKRGWQASLGTDGKAMLDFNRNFLMKTYGLDR